MALTIRDTLLWYKRPEVRAAMVLGARNKEIGIRYGEGFGKRPDAIEYEQEILLQVQKGATSFHASEELWSNPKSIETGMNKQATADLRTGWDLVLDIDFTNFEATKVITNALCEALQENGVDHFGVKFSGNKGFHIGVAWESFPSELGGVSVAQQFPDAARIIANFLVWSIDNPDNGFQLSEKIKKLMSVSEAAAHLKKVCAQCGIDRKERKYVQHYSCRRCGHHEEKPAEFNDVPVCPKCSSIMERIVDHREQSENCPNCKSKETRAVFDLKIDTQLVASRHLYRLEYSLHEKSGLASIPIPIEHVASFSREQAQPDRVTTFPAFWYREYPSEALGLYVRAHNQFIPDAKAIEIAAARKELVWDADAAPEETFPPTITKMLAGMTDGKKRGLFILTNFLRSVGWNHEMIEKRLLEWNAANDPPLRDAEISNHLRYHKQRNQTVLPPNFSNEVYRDLGVLVHDALSENSKNPVQYVRMKLKQRGPAPEKKAEKKSEKKEKTEKNQSE